MSKKFGGFCYPEKATQEKDVSVCSWSIPDSVPPLPSINVVSYINRFSVKTSYIPGITPIQSRYRI